VLTVVSRWANWSRSRPSLSRSSSFRSLLHLGRSGTPIKEWATERKLLLSRTPFYSQAVDGFGLWAWPTPVICSGLRSPWYARDLQQQSAGSRGCAPVPPIRGCGRDYGQRSWRCAAGGEWMRSAGLAERWNTKQPADPGVTSEGETAKRRLLRIFGLRRDIMALLGVLRRIDRKTAEPVSNRLRP